MSEQSQELVEVPSASRQALAGVQFERRGLGGGLVLIPTNLDQAALVAQMLARADVGIPAYLRGNPGACLLIVIQATDWEMNAFSVAKKTYKVNDQIAYEAQLINSVVNTRAPVKGRPRVRYEGEGPELQCFFEYTMTDDTVLEYRSPKVKDIPVKNSPLWKGDPEQQLFYYASRAWARRWVPEVLMGVYTPDEVVMMAQDDVERPRTFEALEQGAATAGAQEAQFEDKLPDAPKDAPKPRQRAKKAEETPDVPQQPAGDAGAASDQAAAASPASDNGTATDAGSAGSGGPTTPTSIKASADGSYSVTVHFAVPADIADPGEIYMIGRVIRDGDQWEGDVQRTPTGDLLFWRDDKPVQGIAKANAPASIWAYTMHPERTVQVDEAQRQDRPTETASAPAAEAGQDSSGSATDASTASPTATSGPTAEPRPSSTAQDGGDATRSVAAANVIAPAFTHFVEVLISAKDWRQDIAPALAELRKTSDWAASPEDARVRLHTMAFHRLQEMIASGYRFDFLDDLHAYRCYVDQEWDTDALAGNHRVMERSKLWLDLPSAAKNAFDSAIAAQKARIAQRGGGGEFN